ncbi:MAG: hypothetical protein KJ579_06770 [Verrucomicrobia bacterium]|nr:hypothetical protein [Verrucomicrobiota bacterium]
MKKWKSIAVPVIVGYVVFNVLGKMGCIQWSNPMIETLGKIRRSQEPDKYFTAEEVRDLISKTPYSDAGWPYSASVEGEGMEWTLRFDPAPMTLWRRLWWAVASWKLHPNRSGSYEMQSKTMRVTVTTWDGRAFTLWEAKRNGSANHALEAIENP